MSGNQASKVGAVAGDASVGPRCDCGYVCKGDSEEERIRDAQRHARVAHGIEVTPDQVTS